MKPLKREWIVIKSKLLQWRWCYDDENDEDEDEDNGDNDHGAAMWNAAFASSFCHFPVIMAWKAKKWFAFQEFLPLCFLMGPTIPSPLLLHLFFLRILTPSSSGDQDIGWVRVYAVDFWKAMQGSDWESKGM